MPDLEQLQNQTELLQFPSNFIWGAATSAYQIEGAISEDGRGLSIWDTFSRQPGKVFNGKNADLACDHYHRWPEDVELIKQLGLKAYRLSVSWPRILPNGWGAINQKGLDFYDRLVDSLLEANIDPYVTLYHWDLPQVLQDQGGWPARDTAYAFAEYTEAVLKRLGDRVKGWITHNEPWCVAFMGYRDAIHAPGLTDSNLAVAAVHHLLLSHGLAMPIIRQFAPRAQAGISLSLEVYHSAQPSLSDNIAVQRADCERNRLFLEPLFRGHYPSDYQLMNQMAAQLIRPGDMHTIAAPIDFLGVNYYSRAILQANPGNPAEVKNIHPEGLYTTMNWEVYPEGLYELLMRLQREYPSRYIVTENGCSTYDRPNAEGRIVDKFRIEYLKEHFKQAQRAIKAGVKLEGYFVWSLMDNFEWDYGYNHRFGLIYVDYATQQRIIKESGYWYKSVINSQ